MTTVNDNLQVTVRIRSQKHCLIVLVYSGNYNKISQIGHLINKRNLFLILLDAGKYKIMAIVVGCVLVKTLSQVADC